MSWYPSLNILWSSHMKLCFMHSILCSQFLATATVVPGIQKVMYASLSGWELGGKFHLERCTMFSCRCQIRILKAMIWNSRWRGCCSCGSKLLVRKGFHGPFLALLCISKMQFVKAFPFKGSISSLALCISYGLPLTVKMVRQNRIATTYMHLTPRHPDVCNLSLPRCLLASVSW